MVHLIQDSTSECVRLISIQCLVHFFFDFNPVSCPFVKLISIHLFVHLPHMIQSDSRVTFAQNDIGEEIKQKAAG